MTSDECKAYIRIIQGKAEIIYNIAYILSNFVLKTNSLKKNCLALFILKIIFINKSNKRTISNNIIISSPLSLI